MDSSANTAAAELADPTPRPAERGSDLEAVAEIAAARAAILAQIEKRIIGQRGVIDQLLIALFARGHCLFVGVPGLAKTLLISTLAETLNLRFQRIQFTPDLMPSDITGTEVLEEDHTTGHRVFKFIQGPVFANLVLADEINRTPPKTQAALLQCMQEYKVTASGRTFDLALPFLVFATQNPIEQEGTYPLPEAQLDRVMLKVKVSYPSKEDEIKILDRMAGAGAEPRASRVISLDDILAAREAAKQVFVDDKVKRYVVDLVSATRDPRAAGLPQLESLIENGASVRASINLIKIAKAHALLSGRDYISPHDIKSIAHDVLRHRVLITYEAEAENKTSDHIIDTVLENVEVP